MSQAPTTRREDLLTAIAGYLTLAAVAAASLSTMRQAGERWEIAAGLLLAFGILLARTPKAGSPGWHSHLYLAVQGSLVAGLLAMQPSTGIFPILYFILSPQAMLLLPQRPAVLWIVAFILVAGGNIVITQGWSEGLIVLPVYAGGYFFFGTFAHALVRADAARRESQVLLAELQEAHRQLQEYAARIEELVVVEERNRLAREMHDTLGHHLTVASVQLEGAQRLCIADPERAASMVGTVRQQVREALSELRSTVAALRTPIEADLQLSSSLSRLMAHFEEATSLTIHKVLPEEMPDLPDTHRLTLFRATQEALTNIQKHAEAERVWLVLTVHDELVTLLVSDDGQGISLSADHVGYGLRGLRERTAQLGGELHLEPRPGGGAQLSLRLPLPEEKGDG